MTDETAPQQMKPQDTVIFMLGELKGQMSSVQLSVAASAAAQSAVNADNAKEHAEFRKTQERHSNDITELRASQPLKVSGWSKAGTIIAIPASAVALVGFIVLYFQR